MNKFEAKFFEKYIPDDHKIRWIIHIHFLEIFNRLFLWLTMWAIFPSIMYYYSLSIKELVPFFFLEWLLLLVFIKVVYDIFDWYNDVWIVTNVWVTQLQRSLFKTDSMSVEFDKMEWIEVEQSWIMDKLFKKWNLIIHKIWDDTFELTNSINPYKALNLIEDTSNEADDESKLGDDKFDVIMDALGWVVETYLDKKTRKSDKQRELEEVIEQVEKNKWTIDLR